MRTVEIDGISDDGAIIAEDFSFVEVNFTTDGRPIRARLQPLALDFISWRFAQMLNYIRGNTYTRGEKFVTQASAVHDMDASRVGADVVLQLAGSTGIIEHFKLTVEQSAKLRAMMLAAEQVVPASAARPSS